MKFSPKENFKHGRTTFEAGNTYDSDNQAEVSEGDVRTFHAAGWAEVEGMDAAPERDITGASTLQPKNAKHSISTTE